MEKSVEALGGMEKAAGWKTSVSTGLMTTNWPGWGDLKADCTYFVQKPDMMVLDQDYSVYDHPFFFRYTYNAGEAWVMVNLNVRQSPRYTEMLEKGLRTVRRDRLLPRALRHALHSARIRGGYTVDRR